MTYDLCPSTGSGDLGQEASPTSRLEQPEHTRFPNIHDPSTLLQGHMWAAVSKMLHSRLLTSFFILRPRFLFPFGLSLKESASHLQ